VEHNHYQLWLTIVRAPQRTYPSEARRLRERGPEDGSKQAIRANNVKIVELKVELEAGRHAFLHRLNGLLHIHAGPAPIDYRAGALTMLSHKVRRWAMASMLVCEKIGAGGPLG
jgi:hypothetical protein